MDYQKLKVVALKDLLREKGLPVSGKKAELVSRLENSTNGTKKPENKKKKVADLDLFETDDEEVWEKAYDEVMSEKYHKNGRKFARKVPQTSDKKDPPIFLIPRQRGKSYLNIELDGVEKENVLFCPISKGFSMQEVSSFSMGPIVGEGLCLVNAAFSKEISEMHIVGGKFDMTRKNFWKPFKPSDRLEICVSIDGKHLEVDGEKVEIIEWLEDNEDIWFEQWELWSKSVALCGLGDFHWNGGGQHVAFRNKDKYISFVEWKKECYIKPSYKLLPKTEVFKFLKEARSKGVSLGLVHPKVMSGEAEKPITREYIRKLFDSPHKICCQPYVVAGKLLDVKI